MSAARIGGPRPPPASPPAAGQVPGAGRSQPAAPGQRSPGRGPAGGTASPPTGHPAARRGGAGIHLPGGGLAGLGLAAAVSAAVVLAGVQRRRRYRPGRTASTSLEPGEPPLPAVIATLRRAAAPHPAATTSARPLAGPAPGTGSLPRPGPPDAGPDRGGHAHGKDPHGHDPASSPQAPGGGSGLPHAAAGVTPPSAASPQAPVPAEPGTVPLGIRDGREVSADIGAMGGLGLTGPGAAAAARAILAALLTQGLPSQPPGLAEVIITADAASVLLPGPGAIRMPGLTVTATLEQALDLAEALLVRRARIQESSDDPGAGPGTMPRPLPAAAALIAVAPRASGRLRGVLEAGRPALAGLLLGEWPPGVTCRVSLGGLVTSADPALDGIQMFHLAAADTAALLSLFQDACGTPAGDGGDPAGGDDHPAPLAGGPQLPAADPASPAPPAGSGDRSGIPAGAPMGTTLLSAPLPAAASDRQAAAPPVPSPRQQPPPRIAAAASARPIRVEVLGPLRISAAGQEIEGGLRKARELAAFLALHPGGASGEAISEALWPGSPPGHGASQRNLALRKLRDLLRAATGLAEPMFVTLAAERYDLDPSLIATDTGDFQAALDTARHAADDASRLAALKDAAALYRGPLADGAGYDWAEPYAEAARRRALDAWTAIAGLLEPAGPDQALAALETALGHDPFNEHLYQRIMRIQAAAGQPDAVRRTLQLLETRLRELGVTPGTQTRQVAAALLGMPGPTPHV